MFDISSAVMLAQDDGGGGGLGGLLGLLIFLVIIAGFWKVYSKAGQPGWACFIPIYGQVVLMRIVGRPVFLWVILTIIFFPIYIIVCIDLAKSFGKGAGFGLGLFFLPPIFFPMLGFGSAKYQGPAAATPAA